MGLVQVATETVTSAVANVTLTGIDSDDVYMIAVNNVAPTTDGGTPIFRVTKSGTAQTDSEYDYAVKQLRTDTSFGNNAEVNINSFKTNDIGTNTGEVLNMIVYLYNFNSSSEYSFITYEEFATNNASENAGRMGGMVLTVGQSCNGFNFHSSTGNISNATATLYKVV